EKNISAFAKKKKKQARFSVQNGNGERKKSAGQPPRQRPQEIIRFGRKKTQSL
ncbi:MAG: LSU ribosomal protein L34p, partial [uncultured Adhaeribacter sp.]